MFINKLKKINIQIIQNINLLSILFISKIFFDFPILYSEIIVVFISILIFEYFFKYILKLKKENSKKIYLNSAINTGVGILFFLKTMNIYFFVFASFISIASKYIIKYKGKHFLNPSNIGLVLTFLLFPNQVWMIGEQWDRNYYLIGYIILFGIYILYRLKYLTISIGFAISYIFLSYFFITPSFSFILFNLTNIGVILFVLYMITDPSIVPKKINKFLYGVIIAFIYILLQYFIKNSYLILLSLTTLAFFHPFIYKYKNKALYIIFIALSIILFLIPYNLSKNIENIENIENIKTPISSIKINKNNDNTNEMYFNFNIIKENKIISKNTNNLNFKKKELLKNIDNINKSYYDTNFLNKNSISSGYFNNDDNLDFFTITSNGLTIGLYNNGGFKLVSYPVFSTINNPNIFYRAIDYNNDGFTDIITNNNKDLQFTIYLNQNGNGHFIKKKINIFAEGYQGLGFADINNDYITDFIIPSNCEKVEIGNTTCKENFVFLSMGKGKYKKINIDKEQIKGQNLKGPTMTSVYGDFYKNKKQLYIGNDLSSPDLIYNIEKNNIILDKNINKYIPISTFQTMSCDYGDVNNDGLFDLFCTDMLYKDNIYTNKINNKHCEILNKTNESYNQYLKCESFNEVANAVNSNDINKCFALKNKFNNFIINNKVKLLPDTTNLLSFEMGLCYNQIILNTSKMTLNENLCKKIDNYKIRNKCIKKIKEIKESNKDISKRSNSISLFPKQKSSNILLINKGNNFIDKAIDYNVDRSDWSWNSQFLDINNDNYLDLYVVNGNINDVRLTPNYLFLNNKGKGFSILNNKVISERIPTYVYTFGDFDNDNDLDIILKDGIGNIYFLENTLGGQNMLSFNVNVEHNNKLYKNLSNIRYDFYDKNNKILFSREPKLSGGYNSLHTLKILFNKKDINYIIIKYGNKSKKINIENIKNNSNIILY